jgi:uncharacterized protein (DUF362 family)
MRGSQRITRIVSAVRTSPSGENIKTSIEEALNLIKFNFKGQIKNAIIKPNLCYYWTPATGQTTDPRVVSAIIDNVREKHGKDVEIKVAEADASAMRTKYVFKCLGYERLSSEKDVELLNLSTDVLVEKTVNVRKKHLSFEVPQQLLTCDLFINVPKIKYMRETKITCAMKNIFGCIGYPRKAKYHPILNEAIVGINKVLHPHLTIVDGLVGLGRFPAKLELVLAGQDPFSVDCVAAQLLGYRPSSVKCLEIAKKEKLFDSFRVKIVGEKTEDFARLIPRQNGIIPKKFKWSIQLSMLKTYRKLSGDVIPPALED